jgi:hypothetical protein
MLKRDPGQTGATTEASAVIHALRIRRLGPRHMAEVERHLVALDVRDRHARFHSVVNDWTIATYVRKLDPECVVLVGAVERATGRILGLAEAHPASSACAVEIAVSVEASLRRHRLGQHLVARALDHAFASGAETAEFLFAPGNTAIAGLTAAIGARLDTMRGYAVISRTTHMQLAALRNPA